MTAKQSSRKRSNVRNITKENRDKRRRELLLLIDELYDLSVEAPQDDLNWDAIYKRIHQLNGKALQAKRA